MSAPHKIGLLGLGFSAESFKTCRFSQGRNQAPSISPSALETKVWSSANACGVPGGHFTDVSDANGFHYLLMSIRLQMNDN